jgi:hypothetical protein
MGYLAVRLGLEKRRSRWCGSCLGVQCVGSVFVGDGKISLELAKILCG